MKTVLKLIILIFMQHSFGQAPAIEWQKTIGGGQDEGGGHVIKTSDGGYLIASSSSSGTSGEKTEETRGIMGYPDHWIIKLDSQGQIEWQRTIGGAFGDDCNTIIQTKDNGYIFAGHTMSDASNEKTVQRISTLDNFDQWIVKIDSIGNILWQKEIGAIDFDHYNAKLVEDLNGNIYFGCTKYYNYYNPNGNTIDDIQNHTNTANPIIYRNNATIDSSFDYFVSKFSSSGNLIFEKTIGGLSSDDLEDIILTNDGGCILAGSSASQISIDKTDNTFGGWGYDIWLIKLDSVGEIEWQHSYGGEGQDTLIKALKTSNDNVVLFCRSNSDVSGNKTEPILGSHKNIWTLTLNSNGQL